MEHSKFEPRMEIQDVGNRIEKSRRELVAFLSENPNDLEGREAQVKKLASTYEILDESLNESQATHLAKEDMKAALDGMASAKIASMGMQQKTTGLAV